VGAFVFAPSILVATALFVSPILGKNILVVKRYYNFSKNSCGVRVRDRGGEAPRNGPWCRNPYGTRNRSVGSGGPTSQAVGLASPWRQWTQA